MRQAGRKKMEELLKVSLLSLLHGCSGLQWVVVCSSVWVLQWVAVGCSGLQWVVVCSSVWVLQWVAVGCSGLWCAAVLLLSLLRERASSLFLKEPYKRDNILQKSPIKETTFCKIEHQQDEFITHCIILQHPAREHPPISSSLTHTWALSRRAVLTQQAWQQGTTHHVMIEKRNYNVRSRAKRQTSI